MLSRKLVKPEIYMGVSRICLRVMERHGLIPPDGKPAGCDHAGLATLDECLDSRRVPPPSTALAPN